MGSLNAVCCLGVCYECGVGTEKNLEHAVALYHKAAKYGSPRAQMLLASCLLYTSGQKIGAKFFAHRRHPPLEDRKIQDLLLVYILYEYCTVLETKKQEGNFLAAAKSVFV